MNKPLVIASIVISAAAMGLVATRNTSAQPGGGSGSGSSASSALVQSGGRCDTPEPTTAQQRLERQRIVGFRTLNKKLFAKQQDISITVPVRINVLHDGDVGNVKDADLTKQLAVLNKAFASHHVKFRLLEVIRTNNKAWFNMRHKSRVEREAKKALGKDQQKTLNLYTANLSNGMLGWATFASDLDGDPEMDGVVVNYTSLPDGNYAPFNRGMTAVHEVGHWLGLWHTFQNGCIDPGDEIDDTAAESGPSSGCPTKVPNTCADAAADPIDNYMDYSDDACMTKFTKNQAERITAQVGIYRPELIDKTTKAKFDFKPLAFE